MPERSPAATEKEERIGATQACVLREDWKDRKTGGKQGAHLGSHGSHAKGNANGRRRGFVNTPVLELLTSNLEEC